MLATHPLTHFFEHSTTGWNLLKFTQILVSATYHIMNFSPNFVVFNKFLLMMECVLEGGC